jgi:hypothetical protein
MQVDPIYSIELKFGFLYSLVNIHHIVKYSTVFAPGEDDGDKDNYPWTERI